MEFNLIKASKFPSISGECYRIDLVDSLGHKTVSNNVSDDPLEHCLLNDGTTQDENPEVAMCAEFLEASPPDSPCFATMESLVHDKASSIDKEHAPEVELKPLPSSLRYEFPGPNSIYPMIVNASLNASQVEFC